ncbi:MAG: hypothetical protein H6Q59_1062 [Firmicutes bacterium]|nr:hypothetical protein [Bacillota bacterium]
MLSARDYISHSLELHLFFSRIMKEHSFFLEMGFTPRDTEFTQQADRFRKEFDKLLSDAVALSNGVVNPEVLESGEVITKYTLEAESASAFYTGIDIATEITRAEAGLAGNEMRPLTPALEEKVYYLNQKAIDLTTRLIQFKSTILTNVLSCRIFTVNYPLLLDHILREAKFYLHMVQRLQSRETLSIRREIVEQELFWNRIMAEHSKFIRGLLDPDEEQLIETANQFGHEFDHLVEESKAAMDRTIPIEKVTEDSLAATREIREFKTQATQGLIDCKIKSIIIPLLGDHTLREANHFLRLLKMFER